MSTNSVSQCRQNFHQETEAAINKQINLKLYSSYVYQSMAFHFDRDDVALHGFHQHFKKQSDEKREQAEKLMKYLNERGGRIKLEEIGKPTMQEWGNGLSAMQAGLEMEKTVNQSLLELHKIGSNHGDAQFCDFLETEFLEKQVEVIKETGNHITNIKRVGSGLGEYMFDKETLDS